LGNVKQFEAEQFTLMPKNILLWQFNDQLRM